jgi:hypothetical protein
VIFGGLFYISVFETYEGLGREVYNVVCFRSVVTVYMPME